MSEQYLPNDIPKTFKTKINTYYCYSSNYDWCIGTVSHSTSELSGDSYLLIAETPVLVRIPKQNKDLKIMVIESLEAEKKKQMAEHHKRMMELQEKIDNLIMIEYKP